MIETVIDCEQFDEVLVYCSDPRLLEGLPSEVAWLPRPKHLDSDSTRANELFLGAVQSLDAEADIVLTVQATSPFLTKNSLIRAVHAIDSQGYDSVVSVSRHRTYAWIEGGEAPLNYSPDQIPKTQDLIPILLETSGFYGFRRERYLTHQTRIHGQIKFIPLNYEESLDIDYPEDFVIAEKLISGTSVLEQTLADSNQGNKSVVPPVFSDGVPPIKHVVFDLDGVLIDSLSAMEQAWTFSCAQLDLEVPFEKYAKLIGLPFPEILASLGIPPGLRTELTHCYFNQDYHNQVREYEGVTKALEALQSAGIELSIFTSKPKTRTERLSEKFCWMTGITRVSPEDISSKRGKPAPDGLLELISLKEIDRAQTVFVGDMEPDRLCAESAGVLFCHAAWGYGEVRSESVPSFASIQNFSSWVLSMRERNDS